MADDAEDEGAPPETLLEESGDLQDSGDSTSESARVLSPHADTLVEESGSDLSESGSSTSESARVLSPHADTLVEESGSDLSESGSSTSESSRVLSPHADTLVEESKSASSRIAPPHAETLLDPPQESGSPSSRIAAPHAETLLETEGPGVQTPPSAKTLPIPTSPAGREAANERARRTQAQPSQSDLGRVPPDDEAGERIGGYRIERELARGGMGVVYLGLDPGLGRKVAIKALLAGEFASEQALERFQIEARSAARLRHPGIVGIHEVGVEGQSRHYLVMDFIEGGSLADRIEDQGPYPPVEAARLMATLSEAVAYAHERGVIHRDLKPANVLLDKGGSPVVTDFGLAKEAERLDGPTRSGQLMGTPAYMPPEQARGEAVDLRVDVYALGAILYEALTGRPPFEAPSLPLLLTKLQDEEPTPLTKLVPGIRPDLATICMACLEKEPEQRYSSATALAEDLVRFLREEPILARPATLAQRGRKWFRRNRVLAQSVGAVVFLAGLIGVVGTAGFVSRLRTRTAEAAAGQRSAEKAATQLAAKQQELLVQRDEAQRQRQSALAAKQEALEQRDEAEKQKKMALSHLQSSAQSMALLTDAVGGELSKIHDERVQGVRARLLDQLMSELSRIETLPGITLESQNIRAKIYLQRADLLRSQARLSDALRLYAKAVSAARKSVVRDEPGGVDYLQRALINRSMVLEMKGEIAAATSASREALDIARSSLAKDPSPERRSVLVAVLLRLSNNAETKGRYDHAQERLNEAVKLGRSGEETEDRRVLAGALMARGQLRATLHDYDMAYEDLREAVKIERARLETLPDLGPNDDLLSVALRRLAKEESRRGRPQVGQELLQEALTFARRRVATDATDAEAIRELIKVLQAVARLKLQRDPEAAAAELEESVQRAKEYYAQRPIREAAEVLGDAISALVGLEESRNNTGAARKRAEALLEHWRDTSKKWKSHRVHQGLLSALEIATRLRREAGAPSEALPLALEAVALQRKLLSEQRSTPDRRRNLAVVLERLGSTQQELGSLDEAQKNFEESALVRRRLLVVRPDRSSQVDLAVILDRLGNLADTRGDHSTAHESHEEAAKLLRELAKGPLGKDMRSNLGIVARKLGGHAAHDQDIEEARELFEESKAIFETLLRERPTDGAQAIELAVSLDRIANLDHEEGRLAEAEQGFTKALRYYLALTKANPRSLRLQQSAAAGFLRLALLHSDQGQAKRALGAAAENLRRIEFLASRVRGSLSLQRDRAVSLYQCAELEAKHGDLNKALAAYEKASEAYAALLPKAPHYAKEGEAFEKAIGETRQRIAWLQGKGAPKSSADWKGLGALLRARGEERDAKQAYRNALGSEFPPALEGKARRKALLAAAALASQASTSPTAPPEVLEEGPGWLREWSTRLQGDLAEAKKAHEAAEGEEALERTKRKLRGLERERARAKASPKLGAYRQLPVWREIFGE
jgi:tetratricopeptide (TPR) repeat protein